MYGRFQSQGKPYAGGGSSYDNQQPDEHVSQNLKLWAHRHIPSSHAAMA
jgi:hypothetical protein